MSRKKPLKVAAHGGKKAYEHTHTDKLIAARKRFVQLAIEQDPLRKILLNGALTIFNNSTLLFSIYLDVIVYVTSQR